MPISPTDFEVVDETKGKTDWSEFEPVAADPKALAFGVEQSLAMPAMAMRGLSIGAEGVDPTRAFQERELRRSMGRIGGLMGDPGAAAGIEPGLEIQATKDILQKPVQYGMEKAHEALAPAVSDFLRTSGIDPASTPERVLNLPRMTPEQAKAAGQDLTLGHPIAGGLMQTFPGVAAGLFNLASGTTESFAQPEQAGLALASGGSSLFAKAAALAFAADQFSELPEQIKEAIKVIRDPKSTNADRVEAVGKPGVSAILGAVMAKHGMTPEAPPMPLTATDRGLMAAAAGQTPPMGGIHLQMPRGAPAPRLEIPGIERATPEEAAARAEQMQREATTTYAQPDLQTAPTIQTPTTPGARIGTLPRYSRLELPEGASDPRVNEIQQKGLKTVNQILAAFPDTLKGNREAARALRNQAFPDLGKDQSAEGIRSDQRQLDQTRPAEVGGEADRGDEVQQAPSGESQPVGAGEEGKTADEAQAIEKADEDFFQQQLGEIQGRAAKTINDEIVKTVQEKGWAGLDESDRRYLTPEQKAAYKAWVDAGRPEDGGKAPPPEEPPPEEPPPPGPTSPPPTTPPTEPPAAPAAEAPAREFEKSSGFTFNPQGVKTQGLTPEQKAQVGQQWEFTDKRAAKDSPTAGMTFYVPEGSTLEQIKAAHEAKLKAEKPAGETKPAAPATEAPVAETKPAEGAAPAVAPAAAPAAPSLAERLVSFVESEATKAEARLKSKGTTFGSGPLHELPNIRDYAIIGAAKLAKFGLDKARYAAEMISKFGKKISPHIDRLFEESKLLLARHTEIQKAKDTPVQELIDQASGAATAPKDTIRQIIDTLQSGLKTVRALKDHFTDAPQVSRAEVKLADDFLEADANRIKESLTDLVKRELPPSERGIFITAINNATRRSPILTGDPEAMYRRAAEVAGRIEERGIEVQKKTAISDIKANVTKALASPTVDLVFKSKIGDLVKGFTFTKPTEQTLARLKTLRDYVDRQTALGKDTAIPKAVLDTLDLLNKVPIKELPLHVLEALRDRIALLEEMGRRTVATRELRWENEKAIKNRELALEPTNPIDKRPEFTKGLTEGVSPLQAIGNLIKRRQDGVTLMDKALLPIDPMLDLLGDGKAEYRGWLFKHVRNPLDLGFNTAKVMSERITKPLVDIIERNGLGEKNALRIGVYAALKQEGGRERLMAMGATKAELDNIEKNLSSAEKQAYTSMREALDRLLPPVQKLMHELYNIPVEPVENYFPMPRDWKKVEVEPKTPKEPKFGEEIAFDDLGAWNDLSGDYTQRTTKEERGSTIPRLKGAKTAIKINAFEVFQQHINDVAHLLSTQRDIKMIGELAKSDLFAKKYGDLGRNLVLDFVDTFARQGRMTGLHRWDVLDTMRKNTSVGVIGLRLASQFVHLSNVPLGMERAGPINYASGLIESWTPKGEQFLKDNFAETFARGGGEPALVEAQTEGGGSVFGKQIVPKSAVKAGFAIARWIDQKNAQATVLGVYLKELQAKGKDPAQYLTLPVDKEAQAHAMVMARRAVASPLPKDVPMVLSRGALTGGNVSLGRALFQFQNIFLDQWSNMRYDLPAYLRNDRVKAARIVFALTTMVAAETLIRETSKEAIKGLTGYKSKREPSTEGRVFTEVARRFPGVSQLMAMAMYPGSGIPILDTFKDIASGAYQAVTAKKAKAQDRGAIRAVSGTAQLLGVPGASQVGELIEKSQ